MFKSKKAKIFNDVNDLISFIRKYHGDDQYIVMASGGFSIIHVGHTRYLLGAANLKLEHNPVLVVVVNGDGWLQQKKGFVPVSEWERAEVVASLSGVDYVLIWDDGTPAVSGAIEAIKPNVFAKGGDRDSAENVPEFLVCEKIGCEVIFGVGGGKTQSSSNIMDVINSNMEG